MGMGQHEDVVRAQVDPRPGRFTTVLLAVAAGLLALSGVLETTGGAVRWMACLEPSDWAAACRMHDDYYGFTPGIDEPVGLGYLALAAVPVLALLAVRLWRLAAVALLLGVGTAVLGLSVLLPLGAAARGQERRDWEAHLTGYGARLPEEALSPVDQLLQLLVSLANLLPGVAVLGVLVLLTGRGGGRLAVLRRTVGGCLVVVGLLHSMVGYLLLNSVSGSHDSPPGMHVVEGTVSVLAAGALVLALALTDGGPRLTGRRGMPGVVPGVLAVGSGISLLLAGVAWAMVGGIRWRYCWETGPGGCGANSGEGVYELPVMSGGFGPLEPQTGFVLGLAWALLLVGVGLALAALACSSLDRGRALLLAALVLAWVAAGAQLTGSTLLMGEAVLGVLTAALGLVVLWQAGRLLPSGRSGLSRPAAGAATSAGSPRRGTPAPAGPAPAAR